MAAPNVLPPNSVVGTDPWVQNRDALNALQAVVREMPHNKPPVNQNCTTDGLLVLTSASVAMVRVPNTEDPENPYDDVRRIDLASLADGLSVMIEAADPVSAPVNIVHLTAGGTLNGEIDLAGDVSAALDAKGKRVWLQRRGLRIVEVARFGFASAGGSGGDLVQFNNDIDANGKAVTNLMRRTRDSASTTTTITTADRDTEVHVSGANVALPTSPTGWRRGDTVILVQRGADMILSPVVNLVTPLNHDRGYGIGATVVCVVHDITNPMKWRIGGLTKGGTVTPPPTEITRVAAWNLPGGTVTTDAASAAYKTAATLTHASAINQPWWYLGIGGLSLAPSNNANQGSGRIKKTTSETEGPTTMAARYSQGRESVGLIAYRSYSVDPGSSTSFHLEINSSNTPTTNSTSVFSPGIFGMKIGTNDHGYGNGSDVVNSVAGTFSDAGSYTATFAAGDYLILGYSQWLSSVGQTGASFRLQVDGANTHERQKHKPTGNLLIGGFSAIKKVTFTAASHTIKVQIGLPTGATGTVTSNRCSIIALKLADFEDQEVDEDYADATTTQLTPFLTTSSITRTLIDGYDYLILGNASLKNSDSAATAHTKLQLLVTISGTTTAYGPEVRSIPHTVNTYHPTSGMLAWVIRGTGVSTTVALGYSAGGTTTSTATVSDSSLAVLALSRP